jgi:hypothetical protein
MSLDEMTIQDDSSEMTPEADTEALPPLTRYRVSSYGADFDVEGLVKRLERGDIFVPDFQRAYVWTPVQASQFIESILLGLPVPGIMLAIEDDESESGKGRRYIVDGLQRLTTLKAFLEGKFPDGKPFRLKGVGEEFEGKSYDELSGGDRRTITDYVIHATIIRQEKPDKDKSGIYAVFRRLNTNGTPLTPQEIRSAIYQGRFVRLLDELGQSEDWRAVFPPGRLALRKESEELILRFLALYNQSDSYKKPLEMFLNSFLEQHKDGPDDFLAEQRRLFTDTLAFIRQHLGDDAFRTRAKVKRQFNRAVYDSIMVGVARRLARGPVEHAEQMRAAYERLLADERYSRVIVGPTTDESSVSERLKLATEAFAAVE